MGLIYLFHRMQKKKPGKAITLNLHEGGFEIDGKLRKQVRGKEYEGDGMESENRSEGSVRKENPGKESGKREGLRRKNLGKVM